MDVMNMYGDGGTDDAAHSISFDSIESACSSSLSTVLEVGDLAEVLSVDEYRNTVLIASSDSALLAKCVLGALRDLALVSPLALFVVDSRGLAGLSTNPSRPCDFRITSAIS